MVTDKQRKQTETIIKFLESAYYVTEAQEDSLYITLSIRTVDFKQIIEPCNGAFSHQKEYMDSIAQKMEEK